MTIINSTHLLRIVVKQIIAVVLRKDQEMHISVGSSLHRPRLWHAYEECKLANDGRNVRNLQRVSIFRQTPTTLVACQ